MENNAAQIGELTAPYGSLSFFLDLDPELSDFASDVIAGLSKPQKTLSPKYLYDERGSQLFDDITGLEAYYPTRTERKIVAENAGQIGGAIGPDRSVLEYGSGSSDKIRQFMDLMMEPAGYVAVDISRDYLIENASSFADSIDLPVGAVCADFTAEITVPDEILGDNARWIGYFPGSTIGNLSRDEASLFLQRASKTLGDDALFFLGVDLEKEADVLRNAYDDPEGVTAAFNLNLLHRMARELGAEVNIDDFEHEVKIPDDPQRIEMHLRAKKPTQIHLKDHLFLFETDETIHTETSNKYSLKRLDDLFETTPWRRTDVWTDSESWFATCLLSNK